MVEVPPQYMCLTPSIVQTLESDLPSRPEDLATIEEINKFTELLSAANFVMEIENQLLEQYLQRADPLLIAKMEQILEAAAAAVHKAEKASCGLDPGTSALSISRRGTNESMISTPRTILTHKTTSQSVLSNKLTSVVMQDKGPRVQPAYKIDIVNREVEEIKQQLVVFKDRCNAISTTLRARHEELVTRVEETSEAREYFEQKIVIEGVDKMTGKVPGEKFMRYLEMKLVAQDSQIDKIRLKTASLKVYLNKVQQQLMQKEELGEILHPVDFEQLEIENKDSQDKLDEKMIHLIEVKKINGRCGTVLSFSRKKLQEQVNELTRLKNTFEVKEKEIRELKSDEVKVEQELQKAKREVDTLTHVIKSYTAPEVMDYIEHKAKLSELKRNLKVWERRLYLCTMALAAKEKKYKERQKAEREASARGQEIEARNAQEALKKAQGDPSYDFAF